ncbi:hypothetical protein QLQ12_07880 [Actinoplanes sp. NEAU-A12]|uniref:Uncharacterized protein n=1 Tax=Actinoplanes sandaracinus TaxID=3045177 RepID=A0ABT6WFK5_9ACTN|nr:hypothetical protein [Actinoplanes sandaracinus]MDI6098521.1 hypothetical protein [Actinoplanes sandaracinus]
MRNMIQLLGGVAVAGVVAAGSTAFTTPGMLTAGAPASIIAGGTASFTPTISGAKLKSISLTNHTTPGEYSAMVLTLQDEANAQILNATVKVTVTGQVTGTATQITCANSSGTFTCTPGTAWSADWSAIAISVTNASTV